MLQWLRVCTISTFGNRRREMFCFLTVGEACGFGGNSSIGEASEEWVTG